MATCCQRLVPIGHRMQVTMAVSHGHGVSAPARLPLGGGPRLRLWPPSSSGGLRGAAFGVGVLVVCLRLAALGRCSGLRWVVVRLSSRCPSCPLTPPRGTGRWPSDGCRRQAQALGIPYVYNIAAINTGDYVKYGRWHRPVFNIIPY